MSEKTTRKKKEKVIGFALDGVLRDISRSLDSVYKKCFPNRAVKLPVSPFNILDSYHFESQEEFAEFLTTEAPTVFGRAEEVYSGVMHEFNKLCVTLKKAGYKPVLISKEVGKTKPGTMFFLSYTGCEIENIRFVSKLEEFWEGVDILVTANPEVIALRPPRKRVVKLQRKYNREVKHVRRILNIKELPKLLGITEQKALPVAPEVKQLPVSTEPTLRDVDTTHMNVGVGPVETTGTSLDPNISIEQMEAISRMG